MSKPRILVTGATGKTGRVVAVELLRAGPLDRYDRELRRSFPSIPQFVSDSEVWRREYDIGATRSSRISAARPRLA
jgi:hypothetical protein